MPGEFKGFYVGLRPRDARRPSATPCPERRRPPRGARRAATARRSPAGGRPPGPCRAGSARAPRSWPRPRRAKRSQRDVPVLAPRARLVLGREQAQRADQARARLVWLEDVVDVAALGRDVGVLEARGVV